MSADSIVRAIEAEHKARCKVVQEAYDTEMAPHRAEFRRVQHAADTRLKASLHELNLWRNKAIRAVQPDRPSKGSCIKPIAVAAE